MSSRKIAVATLLSAGLMLAGNASAEVSGSVTVVSDYLFRGVTQTNENPALQGGVTWNHDSGFYAGAWGSSISWLSDADPDVSSRSNSTVSSATRPTSATAASATTS